MRMVAAELKPGAILGEAVLGPAGRQLAAAGTVLTAQHIQVIRVWGIEAVEIAQAAAAPEPGREALLKAQRAAAARFRGQPVEHPAMRVLFQAAVLRLISAKGKA